MRPDARVLLLAMALDRLLPEPPDAVHPVVWMGRAIGSLEAVGLRRGPRGQLAFGVLMAIVVPGAAWSAGVVAGRTLRASGPGPWLVGQAVLLRSTYTFEGLARAAQATGATLDDADLERARASLRSLVSRDVAELDPPLVAGAAIASVAENTTDSVIGPWLAYAVAGVPGALAYRAVNTLDSMIGYHGRHEWLGKPSARLDDVVNWIPARATAVLLLVAGRLVGGDTRAGWTRLRLERHRVPSPNGGWTMASMAGILGVQLEKVGHYVLGEGLRPPAPLDIERSIRVARCAAWIGASALAGAIAFRHRSVDRARA